MAAETYSIDIAILEKLAGFSGMTELGNTVLQKITDGTYQLVVTDFNEDGVLQTVFRLNSRGEVSSSGSAYATIPATPTPQNSGLSEGLPFGPHEAIQAIQEEFDKGNCNQLKW